MFYHELPPLKDIPDLKLLLGFEQKLEAAIKFISIETVYCQLRNDEGLTLRNFMNRPLLVSDIAISARANISLIKPLLRAWIELLTQDLDHLLMNGDNYSEIVSNLKTSKEMCLTGMKEYDSENRLMLTDQLNFRIPLENQWEITSFGFLTFDRGAAIDLNEHFDLKRDFFSEIVELIDKKIAEHADIPSYPKQPYKWNSEHPHLEIAELVLALINTRLKFNAGKGGSHPKFGKQFYNLFGLDDGPYHSRLQTIRERQDKTSWMHELTDYIEKGLLKKEEATKSNP